MQLRSSYSIKISNLNSRWLVLTMHGHVLIFVKDSSVLPGDWVAHSGKQSAGLFTTGDRSRVLVGFL